jgi:hypothetical protein
MANRARRDLEFAVDDLAWLSTKNLPLRVGTRKLAALFAGPFRVIRVISPVDFKLALPSEWRIHENNHSWLMKAASLKWRSWLINVKSRARYSI